MLVHACGMADPALELPPSLQTSAIAAVVLAG